MTTKDVGKGTRLGWAIAHQIGGLDVTLGKDVAYMLKILAAALPNPVKPWDPIVDNI
ncbi:MAG: hypothetical protein KME07_06175 [Pegethrix bostrychoides GSE-TBD4-15B]|uniref:Uncharacterized protein n=1 Tax=Pegethrix bostrychoides GSE-TBD4-15B TaxID=2839662 RepID=A0A951U3U4_9CYAN|nr:hypothetical protein [Pegethrix bostrychoides GSE-TBD4-15B]